VDRRTFCQVPPDELPLALAELHRSLPVGDPVRCSFPGGTDDRLVDLFTGAGFTEIRLSPGSPPTVEAVRARTLPDFVGPGMRMLVVGLNPSLHAADAGVGYVTPSNRFWKAALEVGLVTVDRDPWHALRHHGVGMTDLVKRATRRADELHADEFRGGVARVDRLCARLQPGVVCVVGLAGWRAAVDRRATVGLQDHQLGGRPVHVMPSTSGLNASSQLPDLVAHLRAALALAA
jgi:double-stranded uracil-DNA glycosylase